MRGVEDAAPYTLSAILVGNVGVGVPDDPLLTPTPRYIYYTNLPYKPQFAAQFHIQTKAFRNLNAFYNPILYF